MCIIPLIKLQNFRIRKMHIEHHHMPNSIYTYILPHTCWKSPERACKVALLVESDQVEWWGSIPDEGALKQEVKIYHGYLERSQLYMELAAILVDILKYWTLSCCLFFIIEKRGRYFFYFTIFYWLVYNFWVNYYIKC